jgi:hypothetical protein
MLSLMRTIMVERTLPYPRSEIIEALEWVGPASRYPGTGTDMHWYAWAADDAVYVVDDDGENFGNGWNFAHFLRITGTPPNHHVEELSTFPELKRHSVDRFRYVDGALAVGNRIFVAAYDYRFVDPRPEAEPAWELLDDTRARFAGDEAFFVDAMSEHAGVAALMYTDDFGTTWQNVPGADTPYFLGPRFAGLAFVGFGPGYTGVPAFLGDYVYAISNDGNWEGGDAVFLARAPTTQVLDRTQWEFWAGEGAGLEPAEPVWTAHEDDAAPIYADPGFVGHPTMVWNQGLGRFLLSLGSDSTPHNWDVPSDVARETWHRRRELKILEGPTPWGPWGVVHFDQDWEGERVAYLPQIPAKWLSEDGLSGTLMFSGDYRFGFLPRPAPSESFYGLVTRQFRLLPRR